MTQVATTPKRPLEYILQAIIGGSELVDADRCWATSQVAAASELHSRHPNLVSHCPTQVIRADYTEA